MMCCLFSGFILVFCCCKETMSNLNASKGIKGGRDICLFGLNTAVVGGGGGGGGANLQGVGHEWT